MLKMPATENDITLNTKRKPKLGRVFSSDCVVSDNDLTFIALNSNLSLNDLRIHIEEILHLHEKIDREAFKNFVGLCHPHVGKVILYLCT